MIYTDSTGKYLGAWDQNPPAGAIEVPTAPADARQVWNFELSAWGDIVVTYSEALAALNAAYQADIAKLNNAFALAFLADGPSEATKMAAIRAQYETRKTQHTANIAALKLEYGV